MTPMRRRRDGSEPKLPCPQPRGNLASIPQMRPIGLVTIIKGASAPSPSIGPTGGYSFSTPSVLAAPARPMSACIRPDATCLWPTTSAAQWRCFQFWPMAASEMPSDVKVASGTIGPIKATHAPPGSFAVSGHDRTHAHMIQADPSERFVLHADLGLDKIFVWKFEKEHGVLASNNPPCGLLATGRRTTALPFPSQWSLVLFNSGGRFHHRAVRL